MNSKTAKISALLLSVAAALVASSAWSMTSLNGSAELSYVKYDATENGKNIFSGNSLAQLYSISYSATNLYYKTQPRYYTLMAGYDLIDFNTKVSEPTQETTIKQSFGRAKYAGEVGYNGSEIPVSFRAFINDNQPLQLKSGLSNSSLVNDGLMYNIEGHGNSTSSGVSMTFEPGNSRTASLRALPRFLLEYRDTTNKSSAGFYRVDNRLRELAVAGLNKENNWIQYRSLNYDNYLNPLDKYSQQQVQLGLVDHRGRRLWSSLTNWIEVSADAQFTDVKSPSLERNLEEYDVNFMAIAKRQSWDARTFMNYNRQFSNDTLTEVAKVPLYVRGIYGSDTDWHVSMSALRGREILLSSSPNADTSYSNTITLGATTFNRSIFTLSPAVSLTTSKGFKGTDSYSFNTDLETASTRRFSDKLGLASKIYFRTTDDGSGSSTSKTWSSNIDLNAIYRPNSKFVYKFQEKIESGSGSGYIDATRLQTGRGTTVVGNYLRNYLLVSAGWTPNARFSTSLDGTYDVIKATDLPENRESSVNYQASYDITDITYRIDTRYTRKDNGVDTTATDWRSTAETQYRPDRYNDALLRFLHESQKDYSQDNTKLELLQRYSYKFFTRTGLIRNIATLTEEYSFTKAAGSFSAGNVQYLLIAGTYSPTDRYSLHGSAKYEKANPAGSLTMYYNAGMTADFRLLSTSIDYTLAKRDLDNRIEKRLLASVKRSF
jgi:hypothetical protein